MDSYKGGGEARRVINVVYFLSRGGRTDQPHLFRVNLSHLHRAGVRLRDVKRWLSEVRGKDMPGNFSWSYKRKYKSGYVWQDLLDDDLITPISDNEYVLKGCDVRRTPPPCSEAPKHFPIDEKKLNSKGSWERKQVEEVVQVQVTRDYDKSSPKPPPPIDQAFPVGAEGNNPAPFRIVLPQDLLQPKQRRQREAAVRSTTKSTDQQQQQALVLAARPAAAAMGGEKQQRPAVGSARRVRVAQVLHSILTCGAADGVDDAAHRPVVPRQRVDDDDGWQRTPFCPGMDGCGISMSRKVKLQRGGGGKDGKAKRDGGRRDRVAAAHKPATLPRCSQCGKGFKPQELHSHMQSCRGLRERMRSSARMSVDRSRSSTAKADHCSTERPDTVFLLTES